MNAEAHVKRAEAQRAIRRAARIARTAVAVHAHDTAGESKRLTGCGTCADACRFVQKHPWGAQACRKSRATPAQQALDRGRPVPFICHMGFACVAAPVYPGVDAGLAMTFGPFVPAEAPDSLAQDARDGLERIEHEHRDELPFGFTDIPIVPADLPAEVAQWLGETLTEQLRRASDARDKDADETSEPAQPLRRNRPGAAVRDAFGARAILAALAGDKPGPLRAAVLEQLRPASGRIAPPALRARTVAVAGAAVEAAEQAGAVPDESRRRLAALPASIDGVTQLDAACRAVLKVLSPIRRAQLRAADSVPDFFIQLDRYIADRVESDVSLNGAAQHFNLTPSTLTRRIERRFHVTFTGYVARARLARAKSMLRRTQLSVDAVAKRAGFTDGAHLRKQLHRFEGTTPSAIRAKRDPKKATG